MKAYSIIGADKLQPMGQTWSAACFGTVHSLKMVRTFFFLKIENKTKKEYMTETICGSQSIIYLLFGPLHKNVADLCSRISRNCPY